MRRLATLEYKRISLSFEQNDVLYELTATKADDKVQLGLIGGKTDFASISIDLLSHIDPDDEEATEHYERLGPEAHERPLWEFLKSLPRPTVITLDRTISAEAEEALFFEAAHSPAQRRARVRTPLSYVREVTTASYAEYRRKAIAHDNELKAQIVMSALQEPDFLSGGRPIKAMTKPELAKLEDKVVSYLSNTIKSSDVEAQVRSFFRTSRLASQRHHLAKFQQDLLLDVVGSRYRQIENLAKAFNDFEIKNAQAFSKLGAYLETINRFFADSKKELYFDESTGRLVFSFAINGARTDAKRAIAHLSSGERQILILFTFLAFSSNAQSIFIVDEPELSLHPKWQHEFMDAFLRLRPAGAQILLATHSPELVGKHRDSCVTLRAQAQ